MTPLDHARFAELDAWLRQALDLPPAERDGYLQQVCAGDSARLKALRELLAHCDEDEADWERLPLGYFNQNARDILEQQAQIPKVIQDWQLLRELGSGGMASVFLAERSVQRAQQRAAIKLLRNLHHDPELLARFERERRILAVLDDPRIARFYDAGLLPDGRPWLAMEYVDGARIDHWCDQHRLDLDARVRLLQQVALAIASAHERLVLHRDIKPANVFVDAAGLPKVLDFGIAKVIEPEDPDAPGLTRTQQRLLTMQYASPEQLLGEPVGIASDVYQLGLMLYELCAGRRPFADDEASLPRLVRAVDERQVPSMRQCLDAAGPAAIELAVARSSSLKRLRRELGSDLQQIVGKAMARDPKQRYASVAQFADDLGHYLARQPVQAMPPSWRNRLQRLVARHPYSSALAGALFLAVIAGVSATLWQTREALHQRDQARTEADKSARLVEFLTNAFAEANPTRTQGETVTAKALLDAARARIDTELPNRDQVRADLLAAMSQAYGGLALREAQRQLAEEALAIERQLNRPQVLTRRMVFAAVAARETSDAAHAYELLQAAEARLRADPAESQGFLGFVLYMKAMTEFSLRQPAQSEQSLVAALAILKTAPDARARDIDSASLMLSRHWATAGRIDEAIALIEATIARIRQAKPARPTELEEALDALGSAYRKAGKIPEQIAAFREALALAVSIYGPEHFDVAVLSHNLAGALLTDGDLAEARRYSDQAVSLGARSVGPDHNFSIAAKMRQVEIRCKSGDRQISTDDWAQLQAGAARFPQFVELVAARRKDCGITD